MRFFKPLNSAVLLALAWGSTCQASGIDQYAAGVIDFSSEYGTSPGDYSAAKAVGAPNVTTYGDNVNAWTPSTKDATLEYIGLRYVTPVYAYGATIRETSGAGSVYKVELRDTGGVWHLVWQGRDPNPSTKIADFFVTWPITSYAVNGVRVHTNTGKTTQWEEIDAVQLSGVNSNATPAVSLEVADPAASESFSSTGVFVLTRSLTSVAAPLTVQYDILGTAVNGTDYNTLSGSATFPANVRKIGLFIKPINDTLKENAEKVTLTLFPSSKYQVMTKYNTGTVTIYSED